MLEFLEGALRNETTASAAPAATVDRMKQELLERREARLCALQKAVEAQDQVRASLCV
jgi:CRISPR/Cas system Type II protein with McrA/HNH and RuvC-like nuclease domain